MKCGRFLKKYKFEITCTATVCASQGIIPNYEMVSWANVITGLDDNYIGNKPVLHLQIYCKAINIGGLFKLTDLAELKNTPN